MAQTASEFLAKPQPAPRLTICACGCGKPLDADDLDRKKTIDGRLVRADCWYDAIGAHIEKNPIHHPGIHRR